MTQKYLRHWKALHDLRYDSWKLHAYMTCRQWEWLESLLVQQLLTTSVTLETGLVNVVHLEGFLIVSGLRLYVRGITFIDLDQWDCCVDKSNLKWSPNTTSQNSVPSTHAVKKENQLQKLSSDHESCGTYMFCPSSRYTHDMLAK